MLLIEQRASAAATPSEWLILPFDSRCKSRLRARLASGEECALFLPRGGVLRGGDRLVAQDGRVVAVVAAPERLMQAGSEDPLQLARAAYHLGNRHVAVQLLPAVLRFAADHVLGDMLRGIGLPVNEIETAFEPEAGAYGAHGHGSASVGAGSGARIHDHFQRS